MLNFNQMMIWIGCSVLLLSSVFQWFLMNKKMYFSQKETILLQDNARFALSVLLDDIRSSGYLGIRTKDKGLPLHVPDNIHPLYTKRVGHLVTGVKVCALGLESVCKLAKENSEALLLWNVPKQRLLLSEPLHMPSQKMTFTASTTLNKSSLILMTNGIQAEIMFPKKIIKNKGKYVVDLNELLVNPMIADDMHTEFYELQTVLYYVGKGTYRKGLMPPGYGLYRLVLGGQAVEIIDNVDDLQLDYGVFDQNNHLIYKKSQNIIDWSLVKMVRINLLLHSKHSQTLHFSYLKDPVWQIEVGLKNATY